MPTLKALLTNPKIKQGISQVMGYAAKDGGSGNDTLIRQFIQDIMWQTEDKADVNPLLSHKTRTDECMKQLEGYIRNRITAYDSELSGTEHGDEKAKKVSKELWNLAGIVVSELMRK